MERLETYYATLGIELLFGRHPRLEEYLAERYDDELVSSVCLLSYNPVSLAQHTDSTPT